jgi:hypothetical protein
VYSINTRRAVLSDFIVPVAELETLFVISQL